MEQLSHKSVCPRLTQKICHFDQIEELVFLVNLIPIFILKSLWSHRTVSDSCFISESTYSSKSTYEVHEIMKFTTCWNMIHHYVWYSIIDANSILLEYEVSVILPKEAWFACVKRSSISRLHHTNHDLNGSVIIKFG